MANFLTGNKVLLLVGGIFTLIGSIHTTIGVTTYLSRADLLAHGVHTQATVVDIIRHTSTHSNSNSSWDRNRTTTTTYSPVLQYICNNQTVTQATDWSSSTWYATGATIPVVCDSNNPQHFTTERFEDTILSFAFLAIGSVLLIVGLICIGVYVVQYRRRSWLKQNGMVVTGTIQVVRLNTGNVTVNNQRTMYTELTVEYIHPMNGTTETVKSEGISGDVTNSIKTGDTIVVYVDPNTPKRAWVDISKYS